MTAAPWIYGVVGLLAAVYPLLALYAYRSSNADPPDADGPAARLRCPGCGAENERGYRFCRSCVAELPGAVDRGRSPAAPTGRGIL